MGRVNDGRNWIDVTEGSGSGSSVKPFPDGDGSIFVSIASYRDGERCGETLKSLFDNAENPGKIVVGLVEQNAPEDKFCLEAYCELYGVKTNRRNKIREGVTKVMANEKDREKCPHFDQVRLVAYHDIQAKGPMLARAMARKVLGNEEFCMQVDAHTEFVKGWDKIAESEWKQTDNEFAIISNVPAKKAEKGLYMHGGERANEVPRQCVVRFLDNGFPDYVSPADGKVADLSKPLLGHGWSAAFSFAKCHLEESVPYDNFAIFAMPIEQFSRFARAWTRGYDVYTPTQNIAFHDYGEQQNGHGNNEWFKRMRDRFRQESITRVKTALQMPGGEPDVNDQANLGIYGLGKRRTLEQLSDFVNINLNTRKGNMGPDMICTGHEYVSYDESIPPTENLFVNPDNLDPQPEYPLRTKLMFYEQVENSIPLYDVDTANSINRMLPEHDTFETDMAQSNMPPASMIFVLWIFGLVVWCIMFNSGGSGKHHGSLPGRRKGASHKDV